MCIYIREIEHLSVYHDQHVENVCVFLKDVHKMCTPIALVPKDAILILRNSKLYILKITLSRRGHKLLQMPTSGPSSEALSVGCGRYRLAFSGHVRDVALEAMVEK